MNGRKQVDILDSPPRRYSFSGTNLLTDAQSRNRQRLGEARAST